MLTLLKTPIAKPTKFRSRCRANRSSIAPGYRVRHVSDIHDPRGFSRTRIGRSSSCRHRRGSTYILVISVAMVASVISLGALMLSASHRRLSQVTRQSEAADRLARAGVERALYFLRNNPRWRQDYTTFSNGDFAPAIELDDGLADWRLKTPDGAQILATDDGPVRIVGRGSVGLAKRQFSVMAYPNGRPLDVLRSCLHATRRIRIFDRLSAGIGPVSSDHQIDIKDNQVVANLETPDPKNTGKLTGTTTRYPNARRMPSPHVFATYASMANEIAFSATTGGVLDSVSIGPTQNPDAGSHSNAFGIYLIRVPAGQTLTITNCQIEGTLLIDLAGDDARLVIGDGVVWHALDDNFPAMIAYTRSDSGTDIEINCRGTLTTTQPINPVVNTHGPPVITTVSARQLVTERPAELNGLFHIIRDVTTPSTATILRAPNPLRGCVLADGPVDVYEHSRLISRPELLAHPPLGYAQSMGDMQYITNSDMENGLEGWQPVGASRRGAGTRLEWKGRGGSQAIRVTNRRTAAAGVCQNVTTWLENGRTFPVSLDAATTQSDESLQLVLEWTSDIDGTRREVRTFAATTAGVSFSTTLNPAWTGNLVSARLVILSTTSTQDFWIDNVSVTDNRSNETTRILVVPTTWIQEPTD